jgi:hypothetical protein
VKRELDADFCSLDPPIGTHFQANMTSPSPFPLERIGDSEIRRLGQVLWSWPPSGDCQNCNGCGKENCIARRSKRLVRFFDHYKDLTASYEPDNKPGEPQALRSHEDLYEIIRKLKSEPHITRAELAEKLFTDRRGRSPPLADQERALNLAVRVMFMINCSERLHSSGLLEHGTDKAAWRSDTTFAQFMADIFPMTDHPSINDEDTKFSLDMKKALMARKLKKLAGLKFRPTDDLRNHLKLDQKTGVVELYHHTAFLKEHLRLSKDGPRDMSITDSLKRQAYGLPTCPSSMGEK